MKNSNFKYHGQCLCGEIQYEVREFSPRMGHCHCSMCRKFHGAAFATYGEVKPPDFHWIKGEATLSDFTADNGTTRSFCKHCGSSLTFRASNADNSIVELALGTLDTPIPHQPDAHIFVANKASWHTISDKLPQFQAGRTSRPLK